jgi:2-polyprenyl-6-methoxyphenol hydroxylase-like FAD-dependent oxidoreductase
MRRSLPDPLACSAIHLYDRSKSICQAKSIREGVMTDERWDVAIAGYGPVGQTLAALLGRRGHRVLVVERFDEIYPLPRAVRLDGEVMRVLQQLDVVADVEHELAAGDRYVWYGADGDIILDIPTTQPHPSGWPASSMFHQPTLERALCARAERESTVTVRRGCRVDAVEQRASGDVALVLDDGETVTARYVVGCDGANSTVREQVGITRTDLGFAEPWIVIDARPHDMADFAHLPIAAQHCDPRRPTTAVQNGRNMRRWEFMLLPGEGPADFDDTSRVWELLEGRMRPDQGEIVRYAVYTFRSLVADTQRAGNVLIAGDAAHLMPPFMGEGMCSGIRDVANLAWKLDRVLRGRASDTLLDTYTSERAPQNHASIAMSVEMGKVSCVLDAEIAAARDQALRGGLLPPPPPLPRLGPGAHLGRGADDELAGGLAVQGTLRIPGGADGRADDVLGAGFVLVVDGAADTSLRTRAAALEVAVAALGDGIDDVDGTLTGWLRANAAAAVLSRPDGYVFGAVADATSAGWLLDTLATTLAG